ncbi:MAG: tetratricopeptide repeat protein [Bacteroidales bacterium]|jgi:tetratricopeptide (TPR) repeat protein|nr:tetratricopeptide repeat protein [Bacteroidales bacterium]
MKQFKTFLAICAVALLSIGNVQAQDLAAATETYNAAATSLNDGNYISALENFNKALKMLEGLGEEGQTMLAEAKSIIPQIHLRYGKELAASKDIDNAVLQLRKAIETGKSYSVKDVVTEATDLLPQVLMADANALLNEGKFAEAVVEYGKVLKADPENGTAYLRIGMAQSRLDKEAEAVAAFEKASELGEKENASKQLSVIYLKKSATFLGSKNWTGAFENALKSNDYNESGQSLKIMGLAAVQLKKFDQAIDALEKYYAMNTNAKDKSSTLYNLATAYEGKGNNAKACGYYKQILTDPTYKQIAEYKVKTQLKCN